MYILYTIKAISILKIKSYAWQNAKITVCNYIKNFRDKTKKNTSKTKLNDQLNKFLKDFLILKLIFL